MAMSAFRRSAATETKQKGGKGGKGSWYEKLNIPKGSPTAVIIMRGNYEDHNPPQELVEIDPATGLPKKIYNDFFKFRKHKRKLLNGGKEEFRDEPCSAGPDPHNPQPCAGCAAMDQGDKSVGVGDQYAFTIVHLDLYHHHPLLDKQTRQIVMKKDSSGPVMVFAECDGRTCNFCRVSRGEQPFVQQGENWPGWQANQFTTTFGQRRYLELGKSHLSDLEGFERSISSICAHPQCGNQLTTDGYACPQCNTMLIDMEKDPRSDLQINEAIMRPYPCLNCRRGVLATEIVSCETCAATGRQYVQTSMFDNVLHLFRQGEGTKSHVMMQRSQSLDSFGQQLTQAGWLRDGKTIRQLIEEIGKPYEFEKVFEPRSLDEQSKKLQLQPRNQQQGYGTQMGGYPQQGPQYGGPPQQGGYQQQPGYAPMPQGAPTYPQQQQQYQQPPQAQGYVPPGPSTAAPMQQSFMQPPAFAPYPQNGAPQNNAGPAPFQPTPRSNYGS